MSTKKANIADQVRIHGIKRKRTETAEQIALRNARSRAARQKKRLEAPDSKSIKFLRDLANRKDDSAYREYFEQFQGKYVGRAEDWIGAPLPYPGREHIDVVTDSLVWRQAFRGWIRHRRDKGLESAREAKYSLTLLFDYLFLVLPWWKELHPESDLVLPTTPRRFARVLFVDRSIYAESDDGQESPQLLPPTLLDLLPLRRKNVDSRNYVIAHFAKFFTYVMTAYEDDEEIAGSKMVNPIRPYFDIKKTKGRTKSNKPPFAEDVYPQLLHFGQAVEAFGEYLQQIAFERNGLADQPWGESYGFDTAAYGYVPIVIYRGKISPVWWIPTEIFTIAKRSIYTNPPGPAGIYVQGRRINNGPNEIRTIWMPHLTTLRLLMGLIENGLRGQGMQWLDRRSWDSLNHTKVPMEKLYLLPPLATFTKLFVNTDKSKEDPWDTYISWRLRRSLLAEQYFQEAVADPDMAREVQYENRSQTRFESVLPLFRSNVRATPVSDGTYADKWVRFLVGFQLYFNSRAGSDRNFEPAIFAYSTAALDPDGVTPREAVGTHGRYCVLRTVTVNTPHSCRVTYASLRDGDLEVTEIAEQLGHDSIVSTNYYTIPYEERVKRKLETIDSNLMGYDVTGTGPGYSHPEHPTSSVRMAFGADRDATLAAYGFVSGVTLWSTADLDAPTQDALELLRESPTNAIRWHSTHVCPVGNQCPADIVHRIGGLHRCGLCPLAAKCVDHLPGIAAKTNELKEKVRAGKRHAAKLEARGSAPTMVEPYHRQAELDEKERQGWLLAQEILNDQRRRLGNEGQSKYHIDSPEVVRKHLHLVTRNGSESAFFLQRIADTNAYPSMETPEVRARAARFSRSVLAQSGRIEDAATFEPEPFDELAAFGSLIKPLLQGKGFALEDVARLLDRQSPSAVSSLGPVLLGDVMPAKDA